MLNWVKRNLFPASPPTRAYLEAEINALRADKDTLLKQRDDAVRDRDAMWADIHDLQSRLREARQDCGSLARELERERNEHNKTARELQAVQGQLVAKDREIDHLLKEIEELQQERGGNQQPAAGSALAGVNWSEPETVKSVALGGVGVNPVKPKVVGVQDTPNGDIVTYACRGCGRKSSLKEDFKPDTGFCWRCVNHGAA